MHHAFLEVRRAPPSDAPVSAPVVRVAAASTGAVPTRQRRLVIGNQLHEEVQHAPVKLMGMDAGSPPSRVGLLQAEHEAEAHRDSERLVAVRVQPHLAGCAVPTARLLLGQTAQVVAVEYLMLVASQEECDCRRWQAREQQLGQNRPTQREDELDGVQAYEACRLLISAREELLFRL
jgi:hypothetical protein